MEGGVRVKTLCLLPCCVHQIAFSETHRKWVRVRVRVGLGLGLGLGLWGLGLGLG